MAKSNAERQAEFRARKAETDGLTQVAGLVPKSSRAEVLILLARLREDPSLEIAVRNSKTGRFERL